MKEIRFGVIGCGAFASWTHLRELRRMRGVKLVAAADPDATARQRVSRVVKKITASPNELLARPDIDAVVISAPTFAHVDLAIAAARAGKNFYVEKPLATSVEEADRILAAAKSVVAVIGFNRRYHPAFEQARVLIAQNKIGRVRAVHTAFGEPSLALPAWKEKSAQGGGALLELGCHHLDLLRWLLQDEVAKVQANFAAEISEGDNASVQLLFRGGACSSSFFSFRAARADHFEIVGERGRLRVDRHRCALKLSLPRRFGYGVREKFVRPNFDAVKWRLARFVRPSWESSYARAMRAFADMCRGRSSHLASLEDGRINLQIIAAAEESARAGCAVRLSI